MLMYTLSMPNYAKVCLRMLMYASVSLKYACLCLSMDKYASLQKASILDNAFLWTYLHAYAGAVDERPIKTIGEPLQPARAVFFFAALCRPKRVFFMQKK